MNEKEMNQSNRKNDVSIELMQDQNNQNNTESSNNKDTLTLFCSDISKINEKDECDWTPLYRSIISGNLKATKILLKNGADPNIQCSMGETPLYQAVDLELLDHVKLLLKNGADPNIVQTDGLSPLHLSVLKQNILITKILLKFKAKPNIQSILYKQTPLHFAIKNNTESMILLILVNSGGSLQIKDIFGKTPIDYIKSEEKKKTVELLKLGKNNEKQKKKYYTPRKTKHNKLTINSVISKTFNSKSPNLTEIKQNNNPVILKNSGKTKLNFIEIKKSNNNNNENEEKENTRNIKVDLFNSKKEDNKSSYLAKNKAKLFYKDKKFNKIKNKVLNISKIKIYNEQESSIKEESGSSISTNKISRNIKENKNIYNFSFSKNNTINESVNKTKNNEIAKTGILGKKYVRKKSTDKISGFKCKSKKKLKINYTETNIRDRRNKSLNNKISKYVKDCEHKSNLNKVNILTSNSILDSFGNFKTQLTTNSNKIPIETSIHKKNIYNKPKIIINTANDKYILTDMVENPLIKGKLKKFKEKNLFNSRFCTYRNNQSNNYLSIIHHKNNKENTSSNIKISVLSGSTLNSNNEKNFVGSSNYSLKSQTFYNYKNNANNSFLEVIQKSNKVYQKGDLPIYSWLKEIDLLNYLPMFLNNKIYSLEPIISDIKKKKMSITKDDIRNIGIQVPGHIYRILVKIEIDTGFIDNKIYEYLLRIKKEEDMNYIKNRMKENEESVHSIYDCKGCGCCSLKSGKMRKKENNDIIGENRLIINLEGWLKNINLSRYKNQFQKNGFDKIEFFILQMFSSIPIEENILSKELNIEYNNDIDLIILQLSKDVKLITNKLRMKRSESVKIGKKMRDIYLCTQPYEDNFMVKRNTSKNCSIF